MRLTLRWLAAGLVVSGSAVYLLQADDSVPTPPPPPHALLRFAPQVPVEHHAYSATRLTFVAYGRTVLDLPILMYHYIREPPPFRLDPIGYKLSVAPDVFAAQMDWLAANDYHTVTFEDMRRYWARVAPLPPRPVIITLDDGYSDLYTAAFPILSGHGFTAVAYIVSGFVGQRGYVTQAEVQEMDRYGIEIAAHSVNHANLARCSQATLTYQLAQSRSWLESVLGHPVIDMAYPSGQYNQATIGAVQRAGYYSAVTEVNSVQHTQADRYEWGRVRVTGGEPLPLFVANLGPAMPTVTVIRPTSDTTPAAMQQQT